MNIDQGDKKAALSLTAVSAFIAGLCCFSPVVIVLLGLGSVSFASSLADTLYGEYKWWFRLVGVALLTASYVWWYRSSTKGCGLDKKHRQRKKLFNLFLISLFLFVLLYIVWLYGVVELIGIGLGLW
ncbi:MAG: hypothetical protein H6774_00185 [Pseudomonadales bacterium]|nr:hypothetical protein [Pseudomonadales bacterium]